jgi:retron-type reverse transcriptase
MIVYNVTINIDREVESEWMRWMKSVHIPEVLATNCFENARMLKMMFEEESQGTTYAVQYMAKSLEMIEQYQQEFAEALQAKHSNRYKDKFVVFRTLLEEV